MKSQLQNSSLFDLLCVNGMQRAEGRVRSKSLLEEMSLIGFIPYTNNYLFYLGYRLNIDLNDHLFVAPYLVRFSKNTPVYPYFKTISKATGKKYKVDSNLFINPIFDEELSSDLSEIKYPIDGKGFLKKDKREN